jgi:hypothetical protein
MRSIEPGRGDSFPSPKGRVARRKSGAPGGVLSRPGPVGATRSAASGYGLAAAYVDLKSNELHPKDVFLEN